MGGREKREMERVETAPRMKRGIAEVKTWLPRIMRRRMKAWAGAEKRCIGTVPSPVTDSAETEVKRVSTNGRRW